MNKRGANTLCRIYASVRCNGWRDVLQTALEGAIDEVAARDVRWRRAPPREHLEYLQRAEPEPLAKRERSPLELA